MQNAPRSQLERLLDASRLAAAGLKNTVRITRMFLEHSHEDDQSNILLSMLSSLLHYPRYLVHNVLGEFPTGGAIFGDRVVSRFGKLRRRLACR
jgi:hypothetical protein